LIFSGVISGELYIVRHLSAVDFLSSSSLLMVAILASQVAQFNPQHEISFSIGVSFRILHLSYQIYEITSPGPTLVKYFFVNYHFMSPASFKTLK
jgi:hypothetical protein